MKASPDQTVSTAGTEGKPSSDKKPTIVRIDSVLKKKLKHLGIEQDKSLNTLIEEAIAEYLQAHQ
jgi:predicted HicB family RNase H-like nuclease